MNIPTQSRGQNANPTSSDQTPTATDTVTIQNYAFSPATITVKVGDTVTWINNDSAPILSHFFIISRFEMQMKLLMYACFCSF
jgi:plastocyanin